MPTLTAARAPSAEDCVILAQVANGVTQRMIGRAHGMKTSAVSMRISRMFLRRALTSTAQLVAVAVREGWIVWDGSAWQPQPAGEST